MTAIAEQRSRLCDGREVVLRPAVIDDAKSFQTYFREGLPEYTEYILTSPEDDLRSLDEQRDWLAGLDEASGNLMLVAEAHGQIVGSLGCTTPKRSRQRHLGQIGMTSRKTYWGSGLGTRMMERLIAWADPHPILELLELCVYTDNNRARRLYQRFGFVEAGVIPGRMKFADGRYKDEVRMYRKLDGKAQR